MNDRLLMPGEIRRSDLLTAPSMRDVIGSRAMFRSNTAPAAATRAPHPMLSMRWYWKQTGRIAGTVWGGVDQSINLKQEGFSAGLLVRVSGQYDIAAGGSTVAGGGLGPYAAIKQFQIIPPGGAAPWKAPGFETKMFNFFDKDFAPFIRGLDSEGVRPTFINGLTRNNLADELFPNAANTANQVYNLWYFIPFHRSSADLRGILPTGTDDVYAITVTPGALADVFGTPGNIANATMVIDVAQLIYDPPAAGSLPLDQRWLYTTDWMQDPKGVPSVTNYSIVTPKKNAILCDVVHTLILNGAGDSADVADVSLSIDGYFIYNGLPRIEFDRISAGYLGGNPPLGVFYFPWDRLKDADGSVAQFDNYYGLSIADWIDQSKVTTFETLLNITGGVAGTSHVRSIARRLTRVA